MEGEEGSEEVKIINTNTSVNFVDNNNSVVGFDTNQSCCECAGWSIQPTEPPHADISEVSPTDEALEPYQFAPDYFKELGFPAGSYDEGGAVCFRLDAPDKPSLYLMLFNSHNGYYSHGFTVDVKGLPKKTGYL